MSIFSREWWNQEVGSSRTGARGSSRYLGKMVAWVCVLVLMYGVVSGTYAVLQHRTTYVVRDETYVPSALLPASDKRCRWEIDPNRPFTRAGGVPTDAARAEIDRLTRICSAIRATSVTGIIDIDVEFEVDRDSVGRPASAEEQLAAMLAASNTKANNAKATLVRECVASHATARRNEAQGHWPQGIASGKVASMCDRSAPEWRNGR
jgi:hypothetical protein